MPPGPLAETDLIADRGAGQWVCTTNERRSGCRALATIGERLADGRAVRRVRVQAARADLGTTLAEALAWAGDRLTDYADRVADEA